MSEMPVKERARVLRDGAVNYGGYFLGGLPGILLVPIMLSKLGAEAYGLWIAAMSVSAVLSSIDFGLRASLTREVAACGARQPAEGASFVRSVASLNLVLGLAGAFLLAMIGVPLSRTLHLSASSGEAAPLLFLLVGIAFAADRLFAHATAVLSGIRRFDSVARLSIAASVLRASAIATTLFLGGALIAAAFAQAIVGFLVAVAALAVVGRLEPAYRFRPARPDWTVLAAHAPFATGYQLSSLVSAFDWRIGTLLIGVVNGSAALVPFHIGQKFPFAVSAIHTNAGEAFFPATSEADRAHDSTAMRHLLEIGTRWSVMLTLPFCLVLAIAAPELLHAWLGRDIAQAAAVQRLFCAVVMFEAVGAGATNVLLGQGAMSQILGAMSGGAILNLIACLLLLPRLGAIGAAWGMLLDMAVYSSAVLYLSAKRCGMKRRALIHSSVSGLLVPALLCAAACWIASIASSPSSRWEAVTAVSAGFAAYLAGLGLVGFREEEFAIVRGILRLPKPLSAYVRRRLRKFHLLRSPWIFLHESVRAWRYRPKRMRTQWELDYSEREDPLGFRRESEKIRFERALELVDGIRQGAKIGRALEVGCAEGLLTRDLAARCEDLLAIEVSNAALARARTRCADLGNVRFAIHDIHSDPLERGFDLIVAVGVLEQFLRPGELRVARDRLVEALRPGGYLIVGTTLRGDRIDHSWWTNALPRWGGVDACIARHPDLRTLRSAVDEAALPFEHVLFQKGPGGSIKRNLPQAAQATAC